MNDSFFDVGINSPLSLALFSAPWCKPCQALKPKLAEIARKLDVRLAVVDIDEQPQTAAKYQVRGVPTVLAFREGKEIGRHTTANVSESGIASLLGLP